MNPHDQRLLLLRTGYDPIPCNGKASVVKDWASRDRTNPAEIGMWSSPAGYPYAQNTGIRTRFTPAIDIDITDPEVAEAVEDLARKTFEEHGATPCRIGQPPKRALLLRTDEPFKILTRSFIPKNGVYDPKKPPTIEILCEGQQLIAFGIRGRDRQGGGRAESPPQTWGRDKDGAEARAARAGHCREARSLEP